MTDPLAASAASAASARLVELAVRDLGIIDSLSLVLGPAMTALTGETGAGKTMLVEAIDLLLGGRADASMVRTGAAEAVVEGRFDVDGEELVLSRVVPADGRSRAYIDGRMATATSLTERAGALVDLHGQHAHQSLLATSAQRAALDRFARTDLAHLIALRADIRTVAAELEAMGGDAGARARESDLLRYQLTELDAAGIGDPEEDDQLDAEESLLADAVGNREAVATAIEALSGDGGTLDALAHVVATLDGLAPFAGSAERLRDAQAEVTDVATELRAQGEQIDDDPARLAELRERRQFLVDLRRKYASASIDPGASPRRTSATLADVMAYRDEVTERLERLDGHDVRAGALDARMAELRDAEAEAAAIVAAARRAAAPRLAAAVEARLGDLGMAKARLAVDVDGPDPGDEVRFMLAANPGSAPAPLARVASGGELARTMLALRLVLSSGPPVLIFDEVDAGIGGQAARAVGQALGQLGRTRQVLVVTHLPQVAACADQQIRVSKSERQGTTIAQATALDGADRVVELSRMLSGTPDSERVRGAAEELLAAAEADRQA